MDSAGELAQLLDCCAELRLRLLEELSGAVHVVTELGPDELERKPEP